MENFIYIHLLMSMIFSILFVVSGNEKPILVPLNYTSIMQTRNFFMSIDSSNLPDPPMPSYTFTLYHRDVFEKSNFKDYDSMLRARLARGHTRASYLASVFENGNNVKEGIVRGRATGLTTTHSAEGELVASFLIGSDFSRSYLLVDTGTDLVWWQCGPCSRCYKQIYHPIYNSTASKTFQKIDCTKDNSSCITEDPAFKCIEKMRYCRYDIPYASGIQSVGFMASEVITFTSDHKSQRIMFGCGKNQNGGKVMFSGAYSGIVGLSRRVNPNDPGGYSLPSQLNATLFAFCLPSFDSGESSILSFNKAPWPGARMAKLIPNYRLPQLHFVDLYTIFIDDKEVPVKPSWWQFGKNFNGGVIVDTGTIITHFPQDFYILFRDIFRSEVEDLQMVDNPIEDFDTCYQDIDGSEVYFPVVKLYFGSKSPGSMLFLAQERVVLLIGDQYCLAFKGWDKELTLLGSNQLQAVGLTFDTSENTLTFDLDACD
ncbi:protein ASPARTIC PROTEASE IN GUARD CELL 1-like [Nicotiana sylvestris]|uniref:protein ASPARTIC PROTEASE IN GUARD CELL 1-like n=1 Tax=Nicotiana sylvestris TaxID=4096 RepID=UPI00388C854C